MKIIHTFSGRLSLYIILLTGGVLVGTFAVFFAYSLRIAESNAVRDADNMLATATARIDAVLQNVETAVSNMSSLVESRLRTPDSLYALTRSVLENNPLIVGSAIAFEPKYFKDRGLYFSPYSCREDGQLKSMQLGSDTYRYHDMEWYAMPRTKKIPHWSEPYFDKGGGNMLMTTYSKPLFNRDGEVFAVFTADLSLGWLGEMIGGIKPYPGSYNLMLSRTGRYMVHRRQERVMKETVYSATGEMTDTTVRYIAGQMISGRHGMAVLQNDDTLAYVFYAPVDRTGWSLGIVCPRSQVFASVDKMKMAVILVVLSGLLLLFVLCHRLIRGLTRPLRQFADAAQGVACGDFTAPLPPGSRDRELRELRDSFQSMQESLTEYIEELRQSTAVKERIESELRIASEIQMGMIPKIFPPFPEREDIDLYAELHPAKEVGGDLYDFFIHDGKLYFAIGDVSGKGIPASLFMAVTRSLFRSVATYFSTPCGIIRSMNASMTDSNDSNMFVTLFIGILDLATGRLDYCNAGHNPPIVVATDGCAQFLNVKPNLPVGVLPSFGYEGQQVQLSRGSILFMYTDGITEAENSDKVLYGEAALEAVILATCGAGPKEMTTAVINSVRRHSIGAGQSDDLTIMAIRYTGLNSKTI